ncbi:MAG TPA: hypothetical protein VJ302_06400, partial [Blastocatellia bacterium]|nr:hypothetical protein [Blastocatellia bacterium]
LPPDFTGRLYLAHPAGLPDQEADREGEAADGADGYAAFEEVMMKSGPSSRHAAFRAVAYAAAKIFIETAKASGRELNRATFTAALERLQAFSTSVLPPITFGPHRRIGATGAFVVQVDPLTQQFKPRTGWMEPQEKP